MIDRSVNWGTTTGSSGGESGVAPSAAALASTAVGLPALRIPRLRPVASTAYASPAVRSAIRRERDERRTRFRSHWWFPSTVLLLVVFVFWGLLKSDQLIAEKLIWPTAGTQFVEVGPQPAD